MLRWVAAAERCQWRNRVGAWRFFYEIDEDERVVFLIAAQHRGAAY